MLSVNLLTRKVCQVLFDLSSRMHVFSTRYDQLVNLYACFFIGYDLLVSVYACFFIRYHLLVNVYACFSNLYD